MTFFHDGNLQHYTSTTFGATMVTIRYTIQIMRMGMLLKVSK
jgi:hypothetical protein